MQFKNTEVYNFEGALRGMRNPLNSWEKSDSIFGIGDEENTLGAKADVIDAWITQEKPDIEMYSEEYEELFVKYEEWFDMINADIKISDLNNLIYKYNYIGPKDLDLAQRLIKSGPEHCKFLRQIFVSVDITMPLYWWKEFDTYKIGTTANSTSTMHTLTKNEITKDMFAFDDYQLMSIKQPLINNQSFNFLVNDATDVIVESCEKLRLKFLETGSKDYWRALVQMLPEAFLQTRTVTMSYANLRNIYFQRKNHKLTEWHSFCNWIKQLPYAYELIYFTGEDNEHSKTN